MRILSVSELKKWINAIYTVKEYHYNAIPTIEMDEILDGLKRFGRMSDDPNSFSAQRDSVWDQALEAVRKAIEDKVNK